MLIAPMQRDPVPYFCTSERHPQIFPKSTSGSRAMETVPKSLWIGSVMVSDLLCFALWRHSLG